jgi:hypothetical protein
MINSNERAWDEMNYATRDATNVALRGDTDRLDKDDIHTMLMAAGMTPGIGNIADAADAILYATEGEFGEAAWSATAMIPLVGQFVSAKKIAKKFDRLPVGVRNQLKDKLPVWVSYGDRWKSLGPHLPHTAATKAARAEMKEQNFARLIINDKIKKGRKALEEQIQLEKNLDDLINKFMSK